MRFEVHDAVGRLGRRGARALRLDVRVQLHGVVAGGIVPERVLGVRRRVAIIVSEPTGGFPELVVEVL